MSKFRVHLIVSHVNCLHISRQDYSIYVYTISTMSSEKHLDGDTGELLEFEVLLTMQACQAFQRKTLGP
jgi:hypothetical protein